MIPDTNPVLFLRIDKKKIPVADILRFEGNGNYSYVQTTTKRYLVSKTLLVFQRELPDFVRTHRSYLVNPVHCLHIDFPRKVYCCITQSDGAEIPVTKHLLNGYQQISVGADLSTVLNHLQTEKLYGNRPDKA